MEKSFNDQELADIMNEIENLEKEFSSEAKPSEAKVVEVSPVSADEEQVLSEMVNSESFEAPIESQPSNIIALKNAEFKNTPVETAKTSTTSGNSSMSFKVEGDMKVDLSFQVDGETITLTVGSEGLVIGLQGGATFNLPVKSASHKIKKSA